MKSHSEMSGHASDASPQQEPGHSGRRWHVLRRHSLGATVGVIVPVLGLGLAACGGTSASQPAATTSTAVASVSGPSGSGGAGGRSNARSTNATGGSIGTVIGVSSSGFTLSTPAGGKVTVKASSSTVYDESGRKSSASAVTKGTTVLVIGKVNSTTVTASEVDLRPAINLETASANVISFKDGTQGKSKSVGPIPQDYTQGSGTLASGTKATKATEAALKSYAGGVVDRVVQLGNGDYEVHTIGVNWPHHVFVNQDFKVIGAND